MSKNESFRTALASAAAVVLLGLGGAAAAADGAYPSMPSMGRFLSAPKDAAVPSITAAQLPVQAPPVEQVSVSLTATSIQALAPDPALGVSNADIVLITLPRVVFSQPVAILGAKEGQQEFFLTQDSANFVCRAFGYGPRADLTFAVYTPVRRGVVLMALDKALYQVRALVDGDFNYISTLACKAR